MKKSLLIAAIAFLSLAAEAQVTTPAASPAGSVSSTIGLTEVKIDYYRPRLKGRKVFGEKDVMYPYGTIWRTGANDGTKISFSDDVKVEGINIPKGQYLIFTWPGATEWTVSLYKDLNLGGNTNDYDKSQEAANFKVKAEKTAAPVETLTISIDNIAADNKSGTVAIAWENTMIHFKVEADYDAKVMKSIEANTQVNPYNYYSAAVYYMDNGKDLNKALEWVNLAINAQKEPPYWMLYQKARIQKALGDKKGATETATASLNGATKEKNRDYQKMNEDLIKSMK